MTYAEKRTRAHFQSALIKLIKETGYSKITVKMLVACADYNRTSFYRYYNNLDELSDEIANHILTLFYESYQKETKNPSSEQMVRCIYYTIWQHSDYFDLLGIDDTIPGLKTRFLKMLENILEKEDYPLENNEHEIWNNEYVNSFLAHGTFGIIETWIRNKYEIDYKTMAKYVQKLYSGPFSTKA